VKKGFCAFFLVPSGGDLSPTYDHLLTALDSPNKLHTDGKLRVDQFTYSGIRPIIAFKHHVGHCCDGAIKRVAKDRFSGIGKLPNECDLALVAAPRSLNVKWMTGWRSRRVSECFVGECSVN
jgi:hypothetical protein